jgi:hyperosmotically inducible protein
MRDVSKAFALALSIAVVAGCKQEGAAERAGKKIDQAVEKGQQKLGEAMEQAGKNLEQMGKNLRDKADK